MSSSAIALPKDVTMEILSRLPVKSLLQFRCVQKSWSSLIRHPSFIAKHLTFNSNGSNLDNLRLLLYEAFQMNFHGGIIYSISLDNLEVCEHIRIPLFRDATFVPELFGPCNGILCFFDYRHLIVLWNPATREFKLVRPSDVERPRKPGEIALTSYGTVGFGFDPQTNDYKLVIFVSNSFEIDEDHGGGYGGCIEQIDLYSLRTDSCKEHAHLPVDLLGIDPDGTYFSGFFYWPITEEFNLNCIISFDMSKEVFHKIPLPDFGYSIEYHHPMLREFNDFLALTVFPVHIQDKYFDIWVMNKYGAQEIWTTLLRIEPGLGLEKPLGVSKNGCLFMKDADEQVVLYDPATQTIRNLGFGGPEPYIQVVSYVESVVSICRRSEHEIDKPIVRSKDPLEDV